MKNSFISLNEKTLPQLKQKHPPRRDFDPELLLSLNPNEVHLIKLTSIDAEIVKKNLLSRQQEKQYHQGLNVKSTSFQF